MQWEYLLPGEFGAAVKRAKGVCVIPIGAMEVHGTHLPLGCDALKGIAFTNRAAEIAEVVSCPGAPYFGDMSGACGGGNIAIPLPIIRELLTALCDECYNNGFKKIVFVTSHGGNKPMMDTFVREILSGHPNYIVYHYYQKMGTPQAILAEIEKYPYLTESDIAVFQSYLDEGKYGGHGCFKETSCIYHLYPELVAREKIGELDGHNTHRADPFYAHGISCAYNWESNFPNKYASVEHDGMNERVARAIAEKTVNDTVAALKLIKEDARCDELHEKAQEEYKAHAAALTNR